MPQDPAHEHLSNSLQGSLLVCGHYIGVCGTFMSHVRLVSANTPATFVIRNGTKCRDKLFSHNGEKWKMGDPETHSDYKQGLAVDPTDTLVPITIPHGVTAPKT